MKIITYTDGGARGNPGPAGIGCVLYDAATREVIGEVSEYIGETTNNVAEYTALVYALQKALELGADSVMCYLDSELIVKQMNRVYRVKDAKMQKLFVQVWNLSQQFEQVTYDHVRREKNKAADKLANDAMDRGSAI
jgi:ribonuclease HI